MDLPIPRQSTPDEITARLRVLKWVAIAIGVAVPVLASVPEIWHLTPDLNDGAFHLGVVRNTISAVKEGQNPLDFWVPTWLCGYPLFHFYQPGPYLALAFAHFATLGLVPLLLLYRLANVLAMILFPIANYRALRWLGYDGLVAACGAFLSWLVSGGGTYGIEFESFLWGGWGLYAQLFALPFLPLALAGAFRAIESGGRTLRYALLLFAACISHILYGYIAAISVVVVPFLVWERDSVRRRVVGLVRFFLQAGALLAFFVLPLALGVPYHAKSLYDEAAKFDSYGAATILNRFFSGNLLDHSRLPILTCLVLAGLYSCGSRWLERKSRVDGFLVCGLVLWLVLYFGRVTWGPLMRLLPLSNGLHLERLSNGVQIFAIWLAAIPLAALVRLIAGVESKRIRAAAAALVLLICALPLLGERAKYIVWNAGILQQAAVKFRADWPDFERVLDRLRSEPPGRVYAGHSGNWGAKYDVGEVHVYHLLSAEAIDDLGNAPFSWALPTDFQFAYDPAVPGSQNLWDVRYVLTDQAWLQPPGAELLIRSGKHALYRMPSEGAFSIVSVPLAVVGDKETTWYATASWTRSAWARSRAHARLVFRGEPPANVPVARMVDPFRYVASSGATGQPGTVTPTSLFAEPELFSGAPPPPPEGSLSDGAQSPSSASVTVKAKAPAIVLFKSTFSPLWNATVDGNEVPTMLLTPGMVGVEVPAGRHEVRLRYAAGWWKLGLLLIGILVAVAADNKRLVLGDLTA